MYQRRVRRERKVQSRTGTSKKKNKTKKTWQLFTDWNNTERYFWKGWVIKVGKKRTNECRKVPGIRSWNWKKGFWIGHALLEVGSLPFMLKSFQQEPFQDKGPKKKVGMLLHKMSWHELNAKWEIYLIGPAFDLLIPINSVGLEWVLEERKTDFQSQIFLKVVERIVGLISFSHDIRSHCSHFGFPEIAKGKNTREDDWKAALFS